MVCGFAGSSQTFHLLNVLNITSSFSAIRCMIYQVTFSYTLSFLHVVLKVSISVQYTTPDQYPNYSPPHYRPASSVTLNCVVEGSTGTVRYRWSSSCQSCFASNGSSQTVSEAFLKSRDTGLHTCTVTDSVGNSGTSSEQMNVTGNSVLCVFSVHGCSGTPLNSQS